MSPFNDPEYWRSRAKQTRARMGRLSDHELKMDLLKVAEEYDRLAEHARRWQAGQSDAGH
jgi:hypothetical protein